MRTTLLHLLCALGVLAGVCGSANAVPVIELAPFQGAVGIQQAPTDLNDLSPFGLNTNPAGNFGPAAFHNNTGMLFTDFHFSFPAQPQRAGGDGGPFFGGVAGTFTTLDFTLDGGTGIPNSTNLTIEARNFNGVTRIEATPTVPEPTTLLLLGTTMAGLGLAGWRKRRQA